MTVRILHGDALEQLQTLPDESVHSIVTDPPYGLEFMGKEWDTFKTGRAEKYAKGGGIDSEAIARQSGKGGAGPQYVSRPARRCAKCGKQAWSGSPCACTEPAWTIDNSPLHAFQDWTEAWARECLRVLKPGGHLLSFGGSRTYHRMACAIEDAGFEIRDQIMWLYGSGFPKSLDVSKAIDRTAPRAGMFEAFAAHFDACWQASGMTRRDLVPHFPAYKNAESVMAQLSNWKLGKNVPSREDFTTLQRLIGLSDEWGPLIERIEAEREVTGTRRDNGGRSVPFLAANGNQGHDFETTAPATESARQWQGWGTALKPAHEPIVVARKPLIGTVAANVLKHGTGAINVDACRIIAAEGVEPFQWSAPRGGIWKTDSQAQAQAQAQALGRWPANIIHDGSDEVLAGFPDVHGAGFAQAGKQGQPANPDGYDGWGNIGLGPNGARFGDSGSAARFFYTAKASRDDRNIGCDGLALHDVYSEAAVTPMRDQREQQQRANHHPTVKPTDLMQYPSPAGNATRRHRA